MEVVDVWPSVWHRKLPVGRRRRPFGTCASGVYCIPPERTGQGVAWLRLGRKARHGGVWGEGQPARDGGGGTRREARGT